MTRINLDGSVMDAMLKMAEGNPGAATVMGQIMSKCFITSSNQVREFWLNYIRTKH